MIHELRFMADRIQCAVCSRSAECLVRDRRNDCRVIEMELRCHGRTERRELSETQIVDGNFGAFLAPAFQEQARLRSRKDPALLQFNRLRKSMVRPLLFALLLAGCSTTADKCSDEFLSELAARETAELIAACSAVPREEHCSAADPIREKYAALREDWVQCQ